MWERVGPFDSSFRLYFEETEWLGRVERAGLPPGYVPAAEAVHFHGRSAEQQAEAPAWFADSARRYRLDRYGRRFNRLLEGLARRPAAPAAEYGSPRSAVPLGPPGSGRWIEVSPNPVGFPAAAERVENGDARMAAAERAGRAAGRRDPLRPGVRRPRPRAGPLPTERRRGGLVRVTYVLPFPELNGGNKVIFQHARLLAGGGDEVTVLGQGPRPAWFPLPTYHDYAAAPVPALPPQDLVIATYWTTVETALDLDLGPVAHFCQGYEGDLEHLGAQRAGDRGGVPGAAADAHRDPASRRAAGPAVRAPQPGRAAAGRPAVPAVAWAAAAASPAPAVDRDSRDLRGGGEGRARPRSTRCACCAPRASPCRVLRLSLHPLTAAETSRLAPDRVLTGVPPAAIARALRRCDLLLLTSRPGEGFGLPLLEAMASGVPAVASRLPSTEFLTAGAVPLVEPGDADGFASAARRLLSDRGEWRAARRRGAEAARRFHAAAVEPALREAVRWAATTGALDAVAVAADSLARDAELDSPR